MRKLSLIVAALALTACGEKELGITEVCKSKPELCADLYEDGHCRLERSELILQRFAERKMPSDVNKYRLLLKLERYSKCMDLVKGIEHIKLKEKTTARVNSFMSAEADIAKLIKETASSDYPGLLYFHWSRLQSREHLERFEQAAKEGKLDTPDLKFALARYYIDRDRKLALTTMFEALKLYKAGDEVDTDIYTSLTSLYFKLGQLPQSYHWAYLAKEAGVERVELETIIKAAKDKKLDTSKIENIADATLDSIESGRFAIPVL